MEMINVEDFVLEDFLSWVKENEDTIYSEIPDLETHTVLTPHIWHPLLGQNPFIDSEDDPQ